MLILSLLVFASPIIFAHGLHMIAVKYRVLTFLNMPVDMGLHIQGRRVFGESKTFRGLILFPLFTILGNYLLYALVSVSPFVERLNLLDFDSHTPLFYGLLAGGVFCLSELPNSFLKRRVGIPEGMAGTRLNILIDHLNSPFWTLLAFSFVLDLPSFFFALGCIFYTILHVLVNMMLYLVGLRSSPY